MIKLDWSIDPETAGIAALVAADAASFLSGLNPSFFTMRAFVSSGDPLKADRSAKDIRIGSAVGTALALLVGFGGSLVTGSWWPFAMTLLVLITIIGSYEYALRNPHGGPAIEEQG